jgi:hypothetical protein
MATVRRVTRRAEPSSRDSIEEKLWPVYIALAILAGFVAGGIIAVSSFEEPRVLYNGWFRLAALVMAVGASMLVIAAIPSRRVRRTVELAAVLSVFLHLVAMAVLYTQQVPAAPELAGVEEPIDSGPVTITDYHEPTEVEAFEQPLETEAPETTAPVEVARDTTQLDISKSGVAAAIPAATPELDTNALKMAESSEAGTPRATEQAQLSRQTASVPITVEPIAALPAQAGETESINTEANAGAIERTAEAELAIPRAVEPAQLEQPAPQSMAPLRRRTAREALPNAALIAAAPNRQLSQPLPTGSLAAGVPQLAKEVGGPDISPAPTIGEVGRGAAAVPGTAAIQSGPKIAISRPGIGSAGSVERAELGEGANGPSRVVELSPTTRSAQRASVSGTASDIGDAGGSQGGGGGDNRGVVGNGAVGTDVAPKFGALAKGTTGFDNIAAGAGVGGGGKAEPGLSGSPAQPFGAAPRLSLARGDARGAPSIAGGIAQPGRIGPRVEVAGIKADAPDLKFSGGQATGEVGKSSGPNVPGLQVGGGGISRGAAAPPTQVAKLDSSEGLSGIGREPTLEAGSINRHTRPDSDIVQPGAARFLSRKAGGPLAIDGRAREPAEAYRRRRGKQTDPSGEYGQPSERSDQAIDRGLEFLSRHQSPDGSWALGNFGQGKPGYENDTAELQSNTAATGLALLAFLGAGYDHYDDQYQGQVRRGLDYLLKNQRPNGDLFVPMDDESNKSVWLYSHGIATIALCEAFGMTGDTQLREPAQKAIDFIVGAQNAERGGWRYTPGRESDTSVSGWQLMALKSGELAGLTVPKETYRKVEKWLDAAQQSLNGKIEFAYNPYAPRQTAPGRFADHGKRPTAATTSMGLLMRLYTGWNRNDPRMKSGCDFLLQNPPRMGSRSQPLRDSYYWYYATQLMFHMKGEYWRQWNAQLHPILVDQQLQTGAFAGSWDPKLPVADRWGPAGGRIYVTTLNLLSLEVYYRHLPIYEQTAK